MTSNFYLIKKLRAAYSGIQMSEVHPALIIGTRGLSPLLSYLIQLLTDLLILKNNISTYSYLFCKLLAYKK